MHCLRNKNPESLKFFNKKKKEKGEKKKPAFDVTLPKLLLMSNKYIESVVFIIELSAF